MPRRRQQHGGLKQKDKEKTGFQPVYDMIMSDSARISLLSYASLVGFILVLTVVEADSEYYELVGNSFSKPVTEFLIKLVVITNSDSRYLPKYEDDMFGDEFPKRSESPKSFFEEARVQQHIWKTSVLNSKTEICPPIANFALFHHRNAKEMTDFFSNLIRDHPEKFVEQTRAELASVFRYLKKEINVDHKRSLGSLVMPKVPNSVTYNEFSRFNLGHEFHGREIEEQEQCDAVACLVAKIALLYLQGHIVHLDLHTKNAMVYVDHEGLIDCKVIDFGKTVDMESHKDRYRERLEKIQEFVKEVQHTAPTDRSRKLMLIVDILNAVNDFNLQYRNVEVSKMNGIYKGFMQSDDDCQEKAFDHLQDLLSDSPPPSLRQLVHDYEQIHHLVNFEQDIRDFVVPFPGASVASPPSKRIKTEEPFVLPTSELLSSSSPSSSSKSRKRRTATIPVIDLADLSSEHNEVEKGNVEVIELSGGKSKSKSKSKSKRKSKSKSKSKRESLKKKKTRTKKHHKSFR